MPPRSKIAQLPEELKGALNRRLIEGGFSGYEDLSAWLTEQGFSIGKSAVGAYGLSLQRRLDSIRTSTEAARLIAQAAPDETDDRGGASISLLQTALFNVMVAIEEAENEKDAIKKAETLSKIARALADLTRAGVTRNKWVAEVREKAADAAAEVKKIAANAGLSEEAIAAIDARIMGIP